MTDAADYKYLLVELEVRAAQQQRFEALMRELLPEVFETGREAGGLNWRLLTALCTPLDQSRMGEEPTLFRYLHLWQLPIRTNLSEAMLSLGRNRRYHELNQLNVSETQDFFTAAVTYAPRETQEKTLRRGRDALRLGADTSAVLETVDVPANWFALHSWQEAMPPLAAEVEAEGRWFLAFALQAESGRLRRYLNFWRPLTPGSDATEAEARDSVSRREIALLKIAEPNGSASASRSARDSPYVRMPYTSVVNSRFRIYKEVDYRTEPT